MTADSLVKSLIVGRGASAALSFVAAGTALNSATSMVNDVAALITAVASVIAGVLAIVSKIREFRRTPQ